ELVVVEGVGAAKRAEVGVGAVGNVALLAGAGVVTTGGLAGAGGRQEGGGDGERPQRQRVWAEGRAMAVSGAHSDPSRMASAMCTKQAKADRCRYESLPRGDDLEWLVKPPS